MRSEPTTESVRAFVAVKMAPQAEEELARLQQRLARRVPDRAVKWSRTDQIHLTLKFLGNVTRDRIPGLQASAREACRVTGPFRLRLSAPGTFPNPRRPRVIWAGLSGDLDRLRRLQVAVDGACEGFGAHRESREFHPHLTLGRVAKGAERQGSAIAEALASVGPYPTSEWMVREIFLVRSHLGSQGATYEDLAVFPLAAE